MRPRWLVQDCISPSCHCSLCIQQNTTSFALGELFITKFRGPGTLKEIIPGFLMYLLRKTNFLRTLLLDRQAMLCYSYVQIIKVSDHVHNYYAYNQGPLNFSWSVTIMNVEMSFNPGHILTFKVLCSREEEIVLIGIVSLGRVFQHPKMFCNLPLPPSNHHLCLSSLILKRCSLQCYGHLCQLSDYCNCFFFFDWCYKMKKKSTNHSLYFMVYWLFTVRLENSVDTWFQTYSISRWSTGWFQTYSIPRWSTGSISPLQRLGTSIA